MRFVVMTDEREPVGDAHEIEETSAGGARNDAHALGLSGGIHESVKAAAVDEGDVGEVTDDDLGVVVNKVVISRRTQLRSGRYVQLSGVDSPRDRADALARNLEPVAAGHLCCVH
jgi:hypothetical protein